MTDIYQEIARITAEGGEAALVTIISATGSTPREEGTKMLVRADGSIVGTIGGGSVEAQVCQKAIEVIRKGKPQRVHFRLKEGEESGTVCGGDMEVFIESILSSATLYIFGGGHISLPLAKIGKLLGFKIAVIDDRAEFASSRRFPETELILAEDFDKAFPKLAINKSDYIVIVTRNHQSDELVLELALGMATQAKYIGMIGSKTKNKTVFSHLLAKGVSQELLDRVHTPIGLEIYAQTPEEIAVSILAEIVKLRRSATISPGKPDK